MIRYFCDICGSELGEERGKPFVRFHKGYVASALVMLNGKPAGDICHPCIGTMFSEGESAPPQPAPAVATLQPLARPENTEQVYVPSKTNP